MVASVNRATSDGIRISIGSLRIAMHGKRKKDANAIILSTPIIHQPPLRNILTLSVRNAGG